MRLDYDITRGYFDLGLTKSGGIDSGYGNPLDDLRTGGGALQAAVWVSTSRQSLRFDP